MTFDLLKVKMLNWNQLSLDGSLALVIAILMSYCASKSVNLFELKMK